MKKILLLMMFICLSVGTMMSQVEGQGYLVLQTGDGQLVLKDSDIDRMTFDIRDNKSNQNFQHMWYITGGDVADGNWSFDVPSGRIPMYIEDEYNGILTFTGYFAGQGFKLVGENWDDQWGMWYGGNFGDFLKGNESDVIKVPSPGIYTIRLDILNDNLTITPADITAPGYTTVSMSGTFNDWLDTDMQRVPGSNSHDWYSIITFNEDTEVKFKAGNSWDVNWGTSWGTKIFPSGQGVQHGANIQVKAGSYIVLFNELTGYYHFYDSSYTLTVVYNVPFFDLPIEFVENYVDFDTYESPTVQLFRNVHIPLDVDYSVSYKTLIGGTGYDGLLEQISTSELESIVGRNYYGIGSVECELTVTVVADVMVNGFPEQYSASTIITCKLPKPTMPEYLYFIGSTDGWTSSSQRLASSGFGIYTGFCYLADPNGWGLIFKFQREAGNWASELNSGSFSQFLGDANGLDDYNGNLEVTAGEGVYYMEVDMNNATFKAVKVNQMSIIGAFSNWSEDVDMTWDTTTYSYKATGVGATDTGWKFRINHDWTINLGGQLNDLRMNAADNIILNADTIELFPTRRDSNNIYCTAE